MLWFDDEKDTPLAEKVRRAAAYYRQEYGLAPDTCYLHGAPGETLPPVDGIRLYTARHILPHHLWLGVSDQEQPNGNQNHHRS